MHAGDLPWSTAATVRRSAAATGLLDDGWRARRRAARRDRAVPAFERDEQVGQTVRRRTASRPSTPRSPNRRAVVSKRAAAQRFAGRGPAGAAPAWPSGVSPAPHRIAQPRAHGGDEALRRPLRETPPARAVRRQIARQTASVGCRGELQDHVVVNARHGSLSGPGRSEARVLERHRERPVGSVEDARRPPRRTVRSRHGATHGATDTREKPAARTSRIELLAADQDDVDARAGRLTATSRNVPLDDHKECPPRAKPPRKPGMFSRCPTVLNRPRGCGQCARAIAGCSRRSMDRDDPTRAPCSLLPSGERGSSRLLPSLAGPLAWRSAPTHPVPAVRPANGAELRPVLRQL